MKLVLPKLPATMMARPIRAMVMAAKLARLTRSPSSHQPRKAAQNGAMPLMKIDWATVV